MSHLLTPMFEPASVAIVGASPQPDSAGNDALLELMQAGFAGRVYPVNPKYETIEGFRCFPSLEEVPEAPDLTVIAVGNSRLEEQLRLAIWKGTKSLVLFGSAHLEDDAEPALTARIRQLANGAGVPICGANCMGFYNNEVRVRIFPQHLPEHLETGGVAYLSQSGSALTALLWNDRKLRFNIAVSSGQELVTTVSHYMDYALTLSSTRVIAIFLECVRDPEGFIKALDKAREKRVPVVILKVGKTEASAALALSHTGAIAGNDAAYQALFDRYGVISVNTLDELAATAALFSLDRPVGDGGVAAIMDSGGEREMIVDIADELGVPFAKISTETSAYLAAKLDPGLEPINPLDAWGTGHDFERVYGDCLTALVNDPASAIGVLVADLTSGFRLHEAFARACLEAKRRSQKPVAVLVNHAGTDRHQLSKSLVEGGVAVLDGTVAGLAAIKHAFAYRDFLRQPKEVPSQFGHPEVKARWRARLSTGAPLDEADALSLLASYGIRTQQSAVVDGSEAAVEAAETIGFPVVVKTAMPGILHKSDVGGVRLNVKTSEELRDVYRDMAHRLGPRVLIAEMVDGNVEVAVGVLHDAQFGNLVMVAAGGTLIELLRDRAIGLAPFSPTKAHELINRLSCRRLLSGMRGAAPCDVEALAQAVSKISMLADDLGDLISEMDVNPLKVGPQGCVAVDALITPRSVEASVDAEVAAA
ncbi:acetate--CoA ligase family protein [Paraburkholderia nemoris]|uniref:acetate--CoA ligase family protein n=1 Tax=Paraburkholderia nemoris TaxID=2793076 RepID=UPI001B2F24FE|nr:acetate--CoA ligase family protein [Paraburkholderia nemoris]CAE6711321.1 Trans-feruloyl-CoA synthase FCS1 [Paraburkholderia nemoris]